MMTHMKNFALFLYDFIVGDDWTIAIGVVSGVLVSALLVHREVNAWWLMPLAVVVALGLSMWRETRRK